MSARVLIVGAPSVEHVGAHLLAAAEDSGIAATIADTRMAWTASAWHRRFNWRFRGKRPTALLPFSAQVMELCRSFRPDLLLATGIAPLAANTLRAIGQLGIRRVNWLLDDPWNRVNGARFFWKCLPEYDTIYSVRTANMEDLRRHGCADVRYLPCAYNPRIHFHEVAATTSEAGRYACELAFVGGCDADRAAVFRPLLRAGIKINLYGGYWDRHADLRSHHRGFAVGRELRLAVSGATVNLCMGRAANRDGHAMRTFELPAMRGCIVVNDTNEHRAIFGPEGERVHYYRQPADVIELTRSLVANQERARQLAASVQAHICNGQHTYEVRLRTMLDG